MNIVILCFVSFLQLVNELFLIDKIENIQYKDKIFDIKLDLDKFYKKLLDIVFIICWILFYKKYKVCLII